MTNFFGDLLGNTPPLGGQGAAQDSGTPAPQPSAAPSPAPSVAPPSGGKPNFFADLLAPGPAPAQGVTNSPPEGGAPAPQGDDPNYVNSTGKLAAQGVYGAGSFMTGIPDMLYGMMPGVALQRDAARIGDALTDKIMGPPKAGTPTLTQAWQAAQPNTQGLINKGLGVVGLNPDSDERLPKSGMERFARGAGAGVASMLVPELGLERWGLAGEDAAKSLAPYIGTGTAKSLAKNAGVGAGFGVVAQGASDLAPEGYKEEAGAIAPVAAGLLMHGAGKLAGKVGDRLPTFSEAGRKAKVGEELAGAATNPEGVAGDTQPMADKALVPGSVGTLGEMTGDQGLQDYEAKKVAGTPELAAVRQEQDKARLAAMPKGAGNASDSIDFLGKQRRQIQESADAEIAGLRTKAQDEAGGLNPGSATEVGGAGRTLLEDVEASEKARMKELYSAYDPNADLSVVSAPIKEAVQKTYINVPEAAQIGISPREKEIMTLIQKYGQTMPLNELGALQTAISKSMREEGPGTAPYDRLQQLRSGVDGTIDATLREVDRQEAEAVAQGRMRPEDTMEARTKALVAKYDAAAGARDQRDSGRKVATGSAGPPPVSGGGGEENRGFGNPPGNSGIQDNVAPRPAAQDRPVGSSKVYYPGGSLDVSHEIAELGDLKASHGMDFEPNPDYPQELQPRDRSSGPAKDQVNEMVATFQPERMAPSTEINSGPPVVGPDDVVESGNGRTMAMQRLYAKGKMGAYQDWLKAQGHDISGFKQPVLIARRTTSLSSAERQYMTGAAMGRQGLGVSTLEGAAADAKLLTPDVIAKAADAPIEAAENGNFVKAFMSKVPVNDRADLIDKNGVLTRRGVERIGAALAHKAYGDEAVIDQAFASTDPIVRGLAGGLVDAAPAWARLRDAIDRGEVSADHDITGSLISDVHDIMQARKKGMGAQSILGQKTMFGEEAGAHDLLFTETKSGPRLASRQAIANNLTNHAEAALKNTTGARLFGEALPAKDVLKTSAAKAKGAEAAEEPEEAPKSGRATFETGAGQNATKPLLDRDTANAMRTATAEYRAWKERQRGVANLTKRGPYKTSAYDLTPDKLAEQLWRRQAAGADGVNRFLDYAGGEFKDRAIQTLKNSAALSLRRELDSEGVLSPTKYQAWRKAHQPALDALEKAAPGAASKFESAASATKAMQDATLKHNAAKAQFEASEAGKLLQLGADADVSKAVGQMLEGKGGVGKMKRLMAQAGKDKSGAASEGLRSAAVERLMQKTVGDKAIEGTEDRALSSRKFIAYLDGNRDALAATLKPDQMRMLEAMRSDFIREQGLGERAKLKSQEQDKPGLGRAVDNYANKAAAGALNNTIASMLGGGTLGGGAAGMIVGILRKLGVGSMQALRVKAITEPEFGRELMQAALKARAAKTPTIPLMGKLIRRALIGASVASSN